MAESTLKRVGESTVRMYGEPGLLVCGFTADQHVNLVMLLEEIKLSDMPMIFLSQEHADITLKQALKLPDRTGFEKNSDLTTAIIMSGFTEAELHKLISSYKKLALPYPLWASLTPISENWKVSALLNELLAEQAAFIKRQKENAKP